MIQYPKQEHVTLPSVEGWGTSMNILKDPPKAVWTRQINKVGSTSQLTMELDGASDRACEYIKVYPRGVNPMVSVSYTNYGTNGGQYNFVSSSGNAKSSTQFSRKKAAVQARLPYPALRDGAFRPPVFRQEDLVPLSRLPRTSTEAWTKPGFPIYAHDLECARPGASKKMRQIVSDRLQTEVAPTRVVDIRNPPQARENYREVHKRKRYVSAVATPAGADRSHHSNSAVSGRIQNPTRYAVPGVRGAPRLVETFIQELDPSRYLSDVSYEDVRTGKSLPTAGGGLETADRQRKYLREVQYKEVRAGRQLAGGDVAVDRQTVRVAENVPRVSVDPRRALRVVQPPVPMTPASHAIQDVVYSDVQASRQAQRTASAQPQSGKNETRDIVTFSAEPRVSLAGARQARIRPPTDLARVLPPHSAGARPTSTATAKRQSETVALRELRPNRPAASAVAPAGTNVGGDFYAVTARKKGIKQTLSIGASFDGKATIPVVSAERRGTADRDGRKQDTISSARNAAAGRV